LLGMPCAGYMPQPTLHHTPYPRQPSPLAPHTPHPHPLAARSLSPMPHSHSTCYVGAPPVASLAITFPPSPPSTPSLPPHCLSSLPLFLTTVSRLPLPPSTYRPPPARLASSSPASLCLPRLTIPHPPPYHTHAPPPTSSLPTTSCHSSLGSLHCLAALADGTSRWSFERRPRGQLATRQQRACTAGKPAEPRARPLALPTPAAAMCFWPTRLHRQHLASFRALVTLAHTRVKLECSA